MTVPTADDILSLSDETIPSFILTHAQDRTLSKIMRKLNQDMLGPDSAARDMAARAIARLGFTATP